MAAVFLAHDLVLEREVAIKVLPPEMTRDRQLVARFQQEAKTAARLDHPNLIPIHRVESEAGLVYIVMKYVSGQSLEETLSRGPLSIPQVRHVLREAALALGHAHRRHVVHRDVKPANIMVDEDGRIVLTDFGISKAVQDTTQITGTGTIIGTPHYMSPEQAKGQAVDGRTDQYALGIVGYRALTGLHPFEGDAQSILYQQVHEAPPSILTLRPDTPPDLRLALDRALAKSASARFPSMEEFASWVSGEHATAVPSATTTVVSTPTKTLQQTPPEGGQGAGIYVAMGTVLVVAAAAFLGIPRLQTAIDGRSAPSVSAASPHETRRAPAKKPAETRPRAAEYALLTVRSNPRAVLYVDGQRVGLTPVTHRRLSTGTHQLRLEQRGYRTVAETIVVKGARPIQRRYELRKTPGR